jgi:hypothetical protein
MSLVVGPKGFAIARRYAWDRRVNIPAREPMAISVPRERRPGS